MSLLPWRDIDTVLLTWTARCWTCTSTTISGWNICPSVTPSCTGVSRAMAEMELQPLFERNAGQLQWYCLDFWSAELKLPVRELKLETAHLIALRPDADTFLEVIKQAGKRVVMITT